MTTTSNPSQTSKTVGDIACCHCGNPCPHPPVTVEGKAFCCRGCSSVYALLHEEGLEAFYRLKEDSRGLPAAFRGDAAYDLLEQDAVAAQVLDHKQGNLCRVTFRIPGIHCTGCVWLLENLYSLFDGFGRTEVDILRKEARIDFDASVISLADVARQLDQLGYAPDLSMATLKNTASSAAPDRLLLKIGLAGFAFGNIMLMAFPAYLGMDISQGSTLNSLFSTISLILSIPVLIFSASEFWKNTWMGLKQRKLSIDLPIVLGIAALFLQSLYELITHQGLGYLDSLCGLVFFLLLGKWYQRRTTDALSFDRDYRSYFPLLARRIDDDGEHAVSINDLKPGDRIRIRNQELVPADCILLTGDGHMDYSFVSGESTPERQVSGDRIYAGGRQCGGLLEVEIIKPVSNSYLTSLWNHASFSRTGSRLSSITDLASRIFTPIVLTLALGTVLFWLQQNPAAALPSMVAVLIVACPCALALSAPFAFGQAMRILGRNRFYLRSADVVDQLTRVTDLLFDKTGTLTEKGPGLITHFGQAYTMEQLAWIQAAVCASTHPLSRQLAGYLADTPPNTAVLEDIEEVPGCGLQARVEGHTLHIGSRAWLDSLNIHTPTTLPEGGSHVLVAIDGICPGGFALGSRRRQGLIDIFQTLSRRYDIRVITGDHDQGTQALEDVFPFCKEILSSQTPHDKLAAVIKLQTNRHAVAMIGDGLNDAGALRQSDVGISVTDDIQAFVPACDAILDARALPRLPDFLTFARSTRRVVLFSFTLSIAYNLAGFSLAAANQLTPVTAAILMPLSSITIVTVATLGTRWAALRAGVTA